MTTTTFKKGQKVRRLRNTLWSPEDRWSLHEGHVYTVAKDQERRYAGVFLEERDETFDYTAEGFEAFPFQVGDKVDAYPNEDDALWEWARGRTVLDVKENGTVVTDNHLGPDARRYFSVDVLAHAKPETTSSVGDLLRVTEERTGHGFDIGTVGRVINVRQNADQGIVNYLITTDPNQEPVAYEDHWEVWEGGVTAWVQDREGRAPEFAQQDPAEFQAGDKVRVAEGFDFSEGYAGLTGEVHPDVFSIHFEDHIRAHKFGPEKTLRHYPGLFEPGSLVHAATYQEPVEAEAESGTDPATVAPEVLFPVGTKVRVTDDHHPHHYFDLDQPVTVVEPEPGRVADYSVPVLRLAGTMVGGARLRQWVNPADITIWQEPEEFEREELHTWTEPERRTPTAQGSVIQYEVSGRETRVAILDGSVWKWLLVDGAPAKGANSVGVVEEWTDTYTDIVVLHDAGAGD